MGLGGGGEVQKNVFAQGKIKCKQNSCTPINPKKYSCYGLRKIQTWNFITKKFLRLENSPTPPPPPPPHNFSNDPLLNVSGSEKIVIYFILQTKFAA